jgi:hypothetical protein
VIEKKIEIEKIMERQI